MTNYSNSYLKRFQECPLACFYHNELKLRKREEGGESHHMAYSKAFHAALEVLYRWNYFESDNVNTLYQRAVDAFLQGYPRQLDASDLAKTRDNGVKALAAYVKRYHVEDRRWRVLQVEGMDHQDDGFVVKLDRVVQDVNTEQIYAVDTKVTGKYLNYDYWRQFEPNSQVVEYVRYVKERFGFCDGFIVDAVSLRYLQRASKNGPAGPWFNFERQTFNVNERQMQADLDSRRYWIDRVEHSKATGQWGMNAPNACHFCEYRDLCKAGWFWPEDEPLIDINYRRICGRWSGEPLFQCTLDRGHEGDHGIAQIDESIEIEVEV